MKEIIGGKRYDTDTAEKLASWSNDYPVSDFKSCSEALYRTKAGAYFIAGSGGPLSRYAHSAGDHTTGGEGIRVATREEAYAWCEGRGECAAIEAHFSDMVSDG